LFYVDFEASVAKVKTVEKCEMKRVVGREEGKTLGGELERL